MQHSRLYVIQFFGIFLLICGYFLSDQPDSLSVMHFNLNPACQSVFTKATKAVPGGVVAATVSVNEHHNTGKRTNIPKHISFEVLLPAVSNYVYHEIESIVHECALPDCYKYLFYREINPPPPKFC